MSDPRVLFRERVIQNRAARRAALADAAPSLPTASSRVGAPFLAGDLVFDSVSGQDATVTACSSVASPRALSVAVCLEDGTPAVRRPDQLIARTEPGSVPRDSA